MRKFEIPIDWTMAKNVIIEAKTLEEAILLALDDGLKNGDYVDESIRISMQMIEALNNVTPEEINKNITDQWNNWKAD
jgi:hypothetical protein